MYRVCFQVPAVTLQHGITIVIVPILGEPSVLIASCSETIRADQSALMNDQIDALHDRGLEAASLCSSTPPAEIKEVRPLVSLIDPATYEQIKRQLAMGHPRLRLLYTTPETLFSKQYEDSFKRCHRQKQLVRLVIDEVSEHYCSARKL